MLQKENFRLENIQRLQKNYKKRPSTSGAGGLCFWLVGSALPDRPSLCIQRRDLPDAPAETSYEIVNRH